MRSPMGNTFSLALSQNNRATGDQRETSQASAPRRWPRERDSSRACSVKGNAHGVKGYHAAHVERDVGRCGFVGVVAETELLDERLLLLPVSSYTRSNQRRHLLLITHVNGDSLTVQNTLRQRSIQLGFCVQRISPYPPRFRRACFHAARSSSVMCSNRASRACASSMRFRFLIVIRTD